MLPLGGLFIALFGGWFMKRESVRHQLIEGGGTRVFYGFWKKVIRYVTPAALAVLFVVTVHGHFSTSTGVRICDLARGGDLEGVQEVVSNNQGSINAATDQGWSALHFAARYGHGEVADYLLEKGTQVNARSEKDGKTPLWLAAKGGNTGIIRKLLEKGASPHIADQEGRTPLHMAAANGDEESVRLLLEKGAPINARDDKGETSLHYAARHGYKTVTAILLKKGANVDAENDEGHTPLELPELKPHKKVRELLESASRQDNTLD